MVTYPSGQPDRGHKVQLFPKLKLYSDTQCCKINLINYKMDPKKTVQNAYNNTAGSAW